MRQPILMLAFRSASRARTSASCASRATVCSCRRARFASFRFDGQRSPRHPVPRVEPDATRASARGGWQRVRRLTHRLSRHIAFDRHRAAPSASPTQPHYALLPPCPHAGSLMTARMQRCQRARVSAVIAHSNALLEQYDHFLPSGCLHKMSPCFSPFFRPLVRDAAGILHQTVAMEIVPSKVPFVLGDKTSAIGLRVLSLAVQVALFEFAFVLVHAGSRIL